MSKKTGAMNSQDDLYAELTATQKKVLKRAISFAEAMVEFSWAGSQPPEDRPGLGIKVDSEQSRLVIAVKKYVRS